jgi:hypothetical protein
LRRKCDGYTFQTLYGRGIDNTSDAISRIEDWSKTDPDRFGTVNDHTDIDDDSMNINNVELMIKNDHQTQRFEVNSLAKVSEVERSANIDGALSNSWFTTPKKEQLRILLNMYAEGDWDEDNEAFSASIRKLDVEREIYYSTKLDANQDIDNIVSEEQHEICSLAGFGHEGDETTEKPYTKRYKADCYIHNVNKKGFYALTWEQIADVADEDDFLYDLKSAIKNFNTKRIEELIKGKKIHCSEHVNRLGKIKPEDLSLYMDVVMVRDRIWAPKSLTQAFFNNLHLGHRVVDMMK